MENALEMDFLLNYPAVIPLDEENRAFSGLIFVQDEAYPVEIRKGSKRFKCEAKGKTEPFQGDIKAALRSGNFSHVVQVLNAITTIIKSNTSNCKKPVEICNTLVWRRVLQEYIEFVNFHVNVTSSKLSYDLTEISVTHTDASRRVHQLKIRVNYDRDSKMFEIADFDLPDCKFEPDDSLIALYEKFLSAVERCGEFLDFMAAIDGSCWVLDPEEPRKADNYRRIALDNNVSVILTFAANNIRQLPGVKFLGPRSATAVLSERREKNFINWDTSGDVLEEILKLLEISTFPKKPVRLSDNELVLVHSGECSICFSSRLDDKLPEIVCPNLSCSQFFHSECLYQWLCSLNSKALFLKIIGACPNCEKPIRCPVPKEHE